MSGFRQRLFGLCVPPLLLCLLDCTLTLVGQSSAYWAGEYARVNEGSPTFYQLLHAHPAAFIAGSVAWALIFVGAILLLPDLLALVLSMAVTFGHTAGAATWLVYRFHYGYQLCNGLFLLSAILVGVGIRWGWRARPEREYRFLKLPSYVRWGLVCLLVGVGVYLYLWPRRPNDESLAMGNEVSTRMVQATASTDQELERLADVPHLAMLCLSGDRITSAGLEHLKPHAELQTLVIRGLAMTGSDLDRLQGLAALKSLYLDDVNIPDADLKHLAGLTQLEAVGLHSPQVTDAWLEPLKGLSQLRTLQLDGTKVTDAGLAHLVTLGQLQDLDLMGTRVSDDGLKHLRGFSQLRRLNLMQTKITDAGLEHLQGLTQLEDVVLFVTNCTPEGEKTLRQSLPKCRIAR